MLILIIQLIGVISICMWLLFWCRSSANVWKFELISVEGGNYPSENDWPSLSVIIPACNEAGVIEEAARSLLEQDYPGLELVFVDDRSDDGTGEIIDRLSAEDPRLTAIHITKLPDGWLGKVNALHVATGISKGEWILFTDADVCFEKDALRQIVADAIGQGADHLAGLPEIRPVGPLLDVAISTFFMSSMFFVTPGRVGDPNQSMAVGVGACNLVRRSAFERTPGLEWLKMETADDLGLGLMMKRWGGQARVAFAQPQISLDWYSSLGEMIRGLEKNSPGLTHYRWWKAIGMMMVFMGCLLGPFGLLFLPFQWSLGIMLFSGTVAWFASRSIALRTCFPARNFLLAPIGFAILTFIFIRSCILLWWRGGVSWRGTQYDIKSLREGQRIEI